MTNYTWDFNDTHLITITGYDSTRNQLHQFAVPGTYTVTVKAINHAGRSFGMTGVIVQGGCTSVVGTALCYLAGVYTFALTGCGMCHPFSSNQLLDREVVVL